MRLASVPTATTLFWLPLVRIATTEGSSSTTPLSRTQIRVLAVPRSMDRSLEKMPRIFLNMGKKPKRCAIKRRYKKQWETLTIIRLLGKRRTVLDCIISMKEYFVDQNPYGQHVFRFIQIKCLVDGLLPCRHHRNPQTAPFAHPSSQCGPACLEPPRRPDKWHSLPLTYRRWHD